MQAHLCVSPPKLLSSIKEVPQKASPKSTSKSKKVGPLKWFQESLKSTLLSTNKVRQSICKQPKFYRVTRLSRRRLAQINGFNRRHIRKLKLRKMAKGGYTDQEYQSTSHTRCSLSESNFETNSSNIMDIDWSAADDDRSVRNRKDLVKHA